MTFKLLLYLFHNRVTELQKYVHFTEQNIHCKYGMPFRCPISKRLVSPESAQSPLSDSPCAQNIQEGHLKGCTLPSGTWVFVVIWALGAPMGIGAPLGIGVHLGVGPSLGIGAPLGIISAPFGVSDHWALMLVGR